MTMFRPIGGQQKWCIQLIGIFFGKEMVCPLLTFFPPSHRLVTQFWPDWWGHGPRWVFLTLECSSELPEVLIKTQVAGSHPYSFLMNSLVILMLLRTTVLGDSRSIRLKGTWVPEWPHRVVPSLWPLTTHFLTLLDHTLSERMKLSCLCLILSLCVTET